jgi:hypothetical protein
VLSEGVRLCPEFDDTVAVVGAVTIADALLYEIKPCVKLSGAVVTDDCVACLGNL